MAVARPDSKRTTELIKLDHVETVALIPLLHVCGWRSLPQIKLKVPKLQPQGLPK